MNYKNIAKEVLELESKAITGLISNLDDQFDAVIEKILSTKGRVIVCGMGKSGIIAKKISATLASTGTPSFFLHPAEAYHGDLGMVTKHDTFIAISNSGETSEILKLVSFIKSNHNYFIAMTGNPDSTLAKSCDHHLNVSVKKEACPLQLAPTSSTTATLAMGDALAVTLMKAKNFQPEHFARFHPGGSLGRRLLREVQDEMLSENLPFVDGAMKFFELLKAISNGKLGMAIVKEGESIGVITDGDLRRAVEKFEKTVFEKTALELMSNNPTLVSSGTRVEDALKLMEKLKISSLLVKSGEEVVGIFKK